jgi:chromosome segregation ATPase
MYRKIFYFIFIAIILTGCSDKPITIEQVRKNESSFKQSLGSSTSASERALRSVSQNYNQLSDYLNRNSLSDKDLKSMEAMLADLNKKRNDFAEQLEDAEGSGKDLISLLKKRIGENSDRAMKRELNASVKIRQKAFKTTISNAKSQLKELDNAIQRFDNIVGYLQVSAGLRGVDAIVSQVKDLREGIDRLEVLVKEYAAESQNLMRL